MRQPPPPGLAARADEPPTPEGLDLKELPRAVRAELKGLTPELADIVGAHLLRAGQLLDTDPQLAYAHAEAARRRAARLAVTREAAGEAAYAAGEYAVALTEFRALRRMNGGVEYLAAMADCERALGHPDKALKLVKEGLAAAGDVNERVELRLVEAGARLDLDQADEALRLLKAEIESSAGKGSRASRARLRYGYADVLERTGDPDGAERWFGAAAVLDTDGETDASDRVAALQGIVLEIDEDDLIGDEPEATPEDGAASDAEAGAEEFSEFEAEEKSAAGEQPTAGVGGEPVVGDEPELGDEQAVDDGPELGDGAEHGDEPAADDEPDAQERPQPEAPQEPLLGSDSEDR